MFNLHFNICGILRSGSRLVRPYIGSESMVIGNIINMTVESVRVSVTVATSYISMTISTLLSGQLISMLVVGEVAEIVRGRLSIIIMATI